MPLTKWEDLIAPFVEKIAKELEQDAKEAEAVMFDARTFGTGYLMVRDGRAERIDPRDVKAQQSV